MRDVLGLQGTVVNTLEAFVERHAPNWQLPRLFAGHIVGADAVADLAFTLGWLHEAGVAEVAGTAVIDAIRAVLAQVDGAATHTFFSYRVAETIGRFGGFDHNEALDGFDAATLDNLRLACDSTEVLALLDALPRNYLAVLSRCEIARERLGLLDDDAGLAALLAGVRTLLGENPRGFLDDSHDGDGRYDIYTADLYLFCEPFADRLGHVWRDGMIEALALVEAVAASDASAFGWGRSTGALSQALSIELAALVTADGQRLAIAGSATQRDWYLRLAAIAADGFPERWFDRDGVITAHRFGATEGYRGPHRRLQMTFDVLGKLAEAAARWARVDDALDEPTGSFNIDGATSRDLEPRDQLVRIDQHAAVWAYRDDALEFVVPFVSGPSSDYAPSPRRPGLFGSPVDSALATFVPLVHRSGDGLNPQRRLAPTGTPTSIEWRQGSVSVCHEGFGALHGIDDPRPCPPISATRHATYRVVDGALELTESLRFDETPEAVSVLVPSFDRPLSIAVEESSTAVRIEHVEVDGMHEWASPWGPATEVAELMVEPAESIELRWSVRPVPVVTTTDLDHHYIRAVYGSIDTPGTGRLRTRGWNWEDRIERTSLGDIFHLHWPEWAFGLELTGEQHRRIAEAIRYEGVKVAWTQHNLTPHLDNPGLYEPIYQVWAQACDLAIHHSEWGRDLATSRYEFAAPCRHVVIPHPHFGELADPSLHSIDRDEAAKRVGLDTTPALRIGVIGAPRRQKHLDVVIEAVEGCTRDDVELVIWSHSFLDELSSDPRIVGHRYDNVDRQTYDLRIAACDVIALPFIEHSMLGTGTASDLVGLATPALVSDWPYLHEYLGDAAIRAGQSVGSWRAAIDGLDAATLNASRRAMSARQAALSPTAIGALTADAIVDLCGPLGRP